MRLILTITDAAAIEDKAAKKITCNQNTCKKFVCMYKNSRKCMHTITYTCEAKVYM